MASATSSPLTSLSSLEDVDDSVYSHSVAMANGDLDDYLAAQVHAFSLIACESYSCLP